MLALLQQLLILYAFILVGWFLGKKRPDLPSHTGILSYLIANFFLPAKVFDTFSVHFTPAYLQNNQRMIFISLGLVLLLHILSRPLTCRLKGTHYEHQVYEYTFAISNFGFMGYALVESLYGAAGLTDQILFTIPFLLYSYTIGYAKLTGSSNVLRRVLNPTTAAIVLGSIFGLLHIPVPETLVQVVHLSSACVGPLSMLLTGMTLSGFAFRDMWIDKQSYLIVAERLVVIPLFIFGLFHLCRLSDVLPAAILVVAMPTGLNPIIFSEQAGESPFLSARLAFLSHLFSVFTLPVWLMLI